MTLEEVAKRAGVSTATVSRVLNGTGLVKEATRKKVLLVAKELKYHPNLHARTLARGKSRTIGMIVSNIENPFFLDIFTSMESAASKSGYSVLVEHTDYRSARLVASVRAMLGRNLAGLAVIVSEMEPNLIEELSDRDLPIAFYDVGHSAENITSIKVRYEAGMQRTVEYLYSLRHRRMAFLGHHAALGPLQARRNTFTDIMQRHAADAQFATVESTDSPAGGRQATRQLLESGFEPTAILCANDFMALGVLKELRNQGLACPGNVSVTGFDNIQLAEYASPALTTVNIPRDRIGQLCFDALVREGNSSELERNILIEPELVVRESTGPAA
jgi:LacI family transcriptional regulator